MPSWVLVNFLVPLFHCFTRFFGVYAQYGQYWTSSYYLGSGILVLAAFAAIGLRNIQTKALAALAVLGVVFALGDQGGLYPVIRKIIPQFGFIRYPIKFICLTVFCAPLLAAFTVRHFRNASIEQRNRSWRILLALGALALTGMGSAIWISHRHLTPLENWMVTFRSAIESAGFLGLVLVALFALGRVASPSRRAGLAFVLPLLVGLDGVWQLHRQNPIVPRLALEPGLVTLTPLPRPENARAMITPEAEKRFHYFSTARPIDDYLASRSGLYLNCNLLDGIPKLDGLFSLYLPEMEAVQRLLTAHPRPPPNLAPLLDFLVVSDVSAVDNPLQWQHRATAMPFFTAGQKPVFAGKKTLLASLSGAGFDPRHMVLLSSNDIPLVRMSESTDATIRPASLAAQRMQVAVHASQATVVVCPQTFYHWWRVFLDDKPASLLHANHAFQAVVVPAGQHRLVFRYQDSLFRLGVAISVLGVIGSCLLMTILRRPPAGSVFGSQSRFPWHAGRGVSHSAA